MKKTICRFFLVALILNLTAGSAVAQHSQRRQQRKHRKTEARIETAKQHGEIDAAEQKAIDKKENKYHRSQRHATRNGVVTNHETHKLNRKNRRLKREVRRSE